MNEPIRPFGIRISIGSLRSPDAILRFLEILEHPVPAGEKRTMPEVTTQAS